MREEDVREKLVQALEADLIGPFLAEGQPGAGEERLPLPPSRWYLTGFLAPKGGEDPSEDDDESVDEALGAGSDSLLEDAGQEEAPQKRRLHFPASMGLSFYLPPGSGDSLEVDVSFADYAPVEEALETTDKVTTLWKRVPYGPRTVRVPLDAAVLASREGVRVPDTNGIVLRGELRDTRGAGLPKGTRLVSLFLVNERTPKEQLADEEFIFQVKLRIRFERGFEPRANHRGGGSDDYDQRVLALLFRDSLEWAVGHNTSLREPRVTNGKVFELETTQLPTYEVRRVEHREIEDAELRMAALAKLDGPALRNALMPIVDAYGGWIDGQRRIPLHDDDFQRTRDGLISQARQTRDRIREGIALIATDEEAQRAFRLANQAMHVAALQTDSTRADKRYKDGKQPVWRPFQLAFVLLNLAAVADSAHRDRKLAELIYFPTGGGKTEAYLGLIAYTLILRRLRGRGTDHEGRGVAVVLRYTLRLLTLDQLGRAATLICALEVLRSKYPRELGDSRFTIGLWVGSAATPNKLDKLKELLDDRRRGDGESPFPLPTCPWCSTPIRVENIKLVDDRGAISATRYTRASVCCDGDCHFTERATDGLGLPVSFVDEQIYRDAPAFVVATVDKYAMVPWIADAGAMFGRVTHVDANRVYTARDDAPESARPVPGGLLPPELIVQDELHLISGPLGTMVGLFEAAVEYLCSCESYGKERPPKIVCSTATVRRAREQIKALFGREMALFPPRGISEGDNFFSTVRTDESGRLYVGVGAPGRALRAVTVRSYATLLAAAQKSFNPKGDPKQPADPYMTLVGYFNSLRELGGMRRLVDDEVATRVEKMANDRRPPHYLDPHPWASNRELRWPEELTSRVSTDTVKRTKDRLATRRVEKGGAGAPEPLDVVLASNMISVGLDIDRLGLMVVTGQPKTTSEYIQATSRVGRTYPGLVVTCLNTARPRDRSHYERFVAYHASFYRDVEATSVTPYSGQALDRGLNAAILAMVRHAIESMREPLGFMRIHENRAAANQIVQWMVARAKGHRRMPDAHAEDRIAGVIASRGQSFLDAWERVVTSAREGSAKRIYWKHDRSPGDALDVLFVATDANQRNRDRYEKQFQFPTSMRDVEPNAHLWVSLSQLDKRQ
jgi:hypothetical protein